MRLLVGAGAAEDPQGKAGLASLLGSLLDQGTGTRTAQEIADQIDTIGGALGTGSGIGPDVRQRRRDEGLVRHRRWSCWPTSSATRSSTPRRSTGRSSRRSRRCRSAPPIRTTSPSSLFDRLVYGFHPYGLPGQRHARDAGRHHARRPAGVPPPLFRAEQHDPGGRRRHDQRRGVRAWPRRCSARWPRAELSMPKPIEPPPPTRRIVVVDKPDAVQTEIRVGQLAIPRKHRGLPGLGSGGEDSRRRGRQPPAPRAALAARPHLRRVGRDAGDEAGRRLRGRDRHAAPRRPARCCG